MFYLVNRLLRIAYALIGAVFYLVNRLLRIAYALIGAVFYLVNRLLRIAYALIGAYQTCGGFFSYFVIMGEHGFLLRILPFLRADWDANGNNAVTDSYGQDWVCINIWTGFDMYKYMDRIWYV